MRLNLTEKKNVAAPHAARSVCQKRLFGSEAIEALRLGDTDVFKEIYVHLKVPLENFLYLLVKSEDEAHDIAQETFIALWENREKLDADKDLRSFIYRIARNKVVNLFAHCQVEERYATEATLVGEQEGGQVDDELIAQETQLLVDLTVHHMPFMRRRVFEMRQNEGLNNEEIASQLHISKENVANHLARARRDIMEQLKADDSPDMLKIYFFLLLLI
ncbi:MAG: sigma-70 family RNA polymerase sigma factor [Mediterranea sp.]|jgi:RNA polymerase sigma-70 factor (ECF subfamily)|nr:sigma-70 family RNA polymerase sigma factor [Mediterranea sp.]